jgi:hypothetical protein
MLPLSGHECKIQTKYKDKKSNSVPSHLERQIWVKNWKKQETEENNWPNK